MSSSSASSLDGQIGITTSTMKWHMRYEWEPAEPGKFTLLELPRILRDELDMRVLDLNTQTLGSNDPAYVDRVRKAADDAGVVITNLKLNQTPVDMSSADPAVSRHALDQYRQSLDSAVRLGCRWSRPLPTKHKPDMKLHVATWRQLCDDAAERGIRMVIEEYGWMASDPRSIVDLAAAIDRNVAGSPDTGSWSDDARMEGLRLSFPMAVTCDYKAREMGPDGEHPAYDLHECFALGWRAGFRGPWCIEHGNSHRATLFRELSLLRDWLRKWMREEKA